MSQYLILMPSQRKRIGFLPRLEVQHIIDTICRDHKLSQSKVTGILVEEALVSRGVLNKTISNKTYNFSSNSDNKYSNSNLISNDSISTNKNKNSDNFNSNESYINNDVQMINDYIEFKFFKNIMMKNKKNSYE